MHSPFSPRFKGENPSRSFQSENRQQNIGAHSHAQPISVYEVNASHRNSAGVLAANNFFSFEEIYFSRLNYGFVRG